MTKRILAFLSAALLTSAVPTYATTIYYNTLTTMTPVVLGGQGFGNTTTVLAIHDNSNGVTTESGCVGLSGTTPQDGVQADCGGELTDNGLGTLVTAGQEAPPPPNSMKNAADTLSVLGITSASQVGVIFNGGAKGGSDVTLEDLSIKLYSSTGTLLLDLSDTFVPNIPLSGQGKSGYLIQIDPTAVCATTSNANETCTALFDSLYASNDIMALDGYVFDSTGSEEDFQIADVTGPVPVLTPEPSSLAMLGTGILCAAGMFRRKFAV